MNSFYLMEKLAAHNLATFVAIIQLGDYCEVLIMQNIYSDLTWKNLGGNENHNHGSWRLMVIILKCLVKIQALAACAILAAPCFCKVGRLLWRLHGVNKESDIETLLLFKKISWYIGFWKTMVSLVSLWELEMQVRNWMLGITRFLKAKGGWICLVHIY